MKNSPTTTSRSESPPLRRSCLLGALFDKPLNDTCFLFVKVSESKMPTSPWAGISHPAAMPPRAHPYVGKLHE